MAPDFGRVHQELKRAGVTLMLVWEEYATGNLLAYKYTSFCVKYRAFAATQQRSMRQVHIAGEKLFVDYAGSSAPLRMTPQTTSTKPTCPSDPRYPTSTASAGGHCSRAIGTAPPGWYVKSAASQPDLRAGLQPPTPRLMCPTRPAR